MRVYGGTNIGYEWNQANWGWNSGVTIPNNTWCMAAVTVNSTIATTYMNFSTTAINSASHTSTTLTTIRIGHDNFGARYFNGSIGIVSVYNRALTSSEISQSFNTYRGRYGL